MELRRACAVVVPLTVAGVLALPAAAGDPRTDGDVRRVRLAGVVAEGGGVLHRRPDGAVDRLGVLRDALAAPLSGGLHVRLSALGTALGAVSGTPVLVVPPTPEDEEPPPFDDVPDTLAVPAGDLDGDGREDVLAYRFTEDGTLVEARRGTDGSRLWSQPLGEDGALAFPIGADTGGDGADDLVLLSIELSGELRTTPVGYDDVLVLDQTLGVVSGADGALAWSTTVRGSIAQSGAGVGTAVATAGRYTVEVQDVLLPFLSPDLTGDGGVDLLVDAVDARFEGDVAYVDGQAVSAFRSTHAGRTATTASIVDGRSGASRDVRTSTDLAGLALAVPLGDLDRDGGGDLVWVTEPQPDVDATCVFAPVASRCQEEAPAETASTVELVDGRSGAGRWVTESPGSYAFVLPLGADADADGVDDLLLEDVDGARLLSGRTGTSMWSLGAPDLMPSVAGVERGVAVVVGVSLDDEIVLERRAAATGELLSQERRAIPVPDAPDGDDYGWGVYWQVLPDGDGDGGRELLVGSVATAYAVEEDEDGWTWSPVADRSAAAVEPLAGGPALLATEGDDLRFLTGFDDLDGDGLTEVLRDVVAEDGSGVRSTVLRLRTGTEVWRFEGRWWELPLPAGDQDGVRGAELLQTVVSDGTTLLLSLRGADLGCRWAAAAPGHHALVGCAAAEPA